MIGGFDWDMNDVVVQDSCSLILVVISFLNSCVSALHAVCVVLCV